MADIDRAALEEAIDQVDLAIAHLSAMHWDDAIRTIRKTNWRSVRAAASAHLETLPKTKMVECWYVTYAYIASEGWCPGIASVAYGSARDAEEIADVKRLAGHACVKVTGPHLQEVPA